MKETTMFKKLIGPSASLLLGLSLAACSGGGAGGDDGSDARLTIMGDSSLTVIQGVETTLRVRYHDSAQAALAGEISFAIEGADASFLAGSEASTDDNGEATMALTVAAGAESFEVLASAPGAQPVSWTVDISNRPLIVDGDYSLDSKFKPQGIDDGVVNAISLFEEMTDDPNDPGTWMVDVLLAELDSSIVSGAVGLARPSLDGWIKDLMLQGAAADYADKANQIAAHLLAFSDNVGTRSEFRVRPWTDEGTYRATHEMISMVANVNGSDFEVTLVELGVPAIHAQNIHVTRTESGEMAIDDHDMNLPYGEMALATLEDAIIPLVQPGATSVHELFTSFVDCQEIGASIADFIGLGSASTYDGPCNAAISTAAGHLGDVLLETDESNPATLKLNGFAKFADDDADGEVDELRGGNWYGSLDMGPLKNRALVEGSSTFTGRRMR
jgi:hypothetical protein